MDVNQDYLSALPVDTPALASSSGGGQARSAPVGTSEFHMVHSDIESDVVVVGATWDVNSPEPEAVYLRYLEDGEWSQWRSLEIDPPMGPDAPPNQTRSGTDPFMLSNVSAVEVIAQTSGGEPVPSLELAVIDARGLDPVVNSAEEYLEDEEEPEEENPVEEEPAVGEVREAEPQDEVAVEVPSDEALPEADEDGQEDEVSGQEVTTFEEDEAFEADAASMPGLSPSALNSAGTVFDTGVLGLKINTRAAWGAPATSSWRPEPIKIKGAVVHHTEGNGTYTQAQVTQQIRNVHHFQAVTRGWGDIGYNLVVDRFGGVWEGRFGGLTNQTKGAQAYGANSETFGITIMGTYMTSPPPAAARQAMGKAIAWKLNLHGINSATDKITLPGEANLRNGSGKLISVPTVSAHRDVGWTDCPGDAFYKQMNTVRSEVTTYLNQASLSSGTTAPTDKFDAGNVITDAQFYNPNAMTEAQIKTFIETQGKNCKAGSGTTCLKDTKFPTQNLKTLRGGCAPLNMSGTQAPWTIIHKTAQACGLNPQVILATLQKEQSGISQPKSAAVWAKAMGSGCPDGSGCDPAQGGFMKQVYYGADKLVSYRLQSQAGHVNAFNAGKAMTIKHNADAKCGSQSVKFANVATASLYEYTPYIGNSTVAGCSATGQKNFWSLMKQYFGGGTPTGSISPPLVMAKVQPTSLGGSNRYETNYLLNKQQMKTGKPVFVVTGSNYPDALSIGPVAGMLQGSVVLTRTSSVSQNMLSLLKERKPSAVYIIGGEGVVSENVVAQLKAATGKTPKRVGGADRYETSALVLKEFFSPRSFASAFVASGEDYPDALAAAAAGGALGRPVLLVKGTSSSGKISSEAVKVLNSKGAKSVVLVGGTGVIDATVENNIKGQGFSVDRKSGANRYRTSLAVNEYVDSQSSAAVTGLWLASGKTFPDALSAAASAGTTSQRLVLTSGNCVLKPVVSDWVNASGSKITKITTVGGSGVMPGFASQVGECR